MSSDATRHAKRRPALWWRHAALCALAATALPAAAFELVSRDDVARDLAAPAPMVSRSLPVPGAPVIELVSPDVKRPLLGPVDIVLRWRAADGAAIDPASFKVLYGRLRLDVTQRLAKHAKVSSEGLEAPNAQLPAGSHRLIVQIADTLKRSAQQDILIEVAER